MLFILREKSLWHFHTVKQLTGETVHGVSFFEKTGKNPHLPDFLLLFLRLLTNEAVDGYDLRTHR